MVDLGLSGQHRRLCLVGFCLIAATDCSQPADSPAPNGPGVPVDGVTWSDGDSGRVLIGGDNLPFRLADVDAAETRRNNAGCTNEIEMGKAAGRWAERMTGRGEVRVQWLGETDRYGRRIATLLVDGADIRELGKAAGHYRS